MNLLMSVHEIPLSDEELILFRTLNIAWATLGDYDRDDLRLIASSRFRLSTRERTIVLCIMARYKAYRKDTNQPAKEGLTKEVKLSNKMCPVYRKLRMSRLQIAYCEKIDIEFLSEDFHLDGGECRALEQLWAELHKIVAPEAEKLAEKPSLKVKKTSKASTPTWLARVSAWLHAITFRSPHSHRTLKYNHVAPAAASVVSPAVPPVVAPASASVETLAGAEVNKVHKALTSECASDLVTDRSASPGAKTP